MKKDLDIESIIELRSFLRTTWQSYATAMITLDSLLHDNLEQKSMQNNFISSKSLAFNFLTSTRSFMRTAEKISNKLKNYSLQEYCRNFKDEFPDHKNSRDIIEHFDEYTLGKGNLQKKEKLILTGMPLNVYLDERSVVIIRVYNLEPIDASKFAYWLDCYMHYLEKNLHQLITPNIIWEGFYPHKF